MAIGLAVASGYQAESHVAGIALLLQTRRAACAFNAPVMVIVYPAIGGRKNMAIESAIAGQAIAIACGEGFNSHCSSLSFAMIHRPPIGRGAAVRFPPILPPINRDRGQERPRRFPSGAPFENRDRARLPRLSPAQGDIAMARLLGPIFRAMPCPIASESPPWFPHCMD